MLPILSLLLILLSPNVAGVQAGLPLGSDARVERRLVAALVAVVREEAEREALASSLASLPSVARAPEIGVGEPEFVVLRADRVRDGPRG